MSRLFNIISVGVLVYFMMYGDETPWSSDYQMTLLQKVGQKIPLLSTYPVFKYPNEDYQEIFNHTEQEKILIFGYGSLINRTSAARTLSEEGVNSIKPAVAFGFKRLFNYKAGNITNWGDNLEENEKAMLNIDATTTYSHVINGVVFEVNEQDLAKLIMREVGYDLVPLLVADWDDLISENRSATVKVAYTFLVPDELRKGVDYTQTRYYPVRGYLHAAQEGAAAFGEKFLDYWNDTTYLSDGTTPIKAWNEETFSHILDTREP